LEENTIALGYNASAKALGAVAIGGNTTAEGQNSTCLGSNAMAKAFSALTVGSFNSLTDNPNASSPAPSDRIFQLGNGSGNLSRSNAMTILRNGNIGIGNNVLNPEYIVDFGGRPRVRHTPNMTAGIYLDDAQGNPDNFVGMV